MRIDSYGQKIYNEMDICNIYLTDSTRIPKQVLCDQYVQFDADLELTNIPEILEYVEPHPSLTLQQFDSGLQEEWFIPEEYEDFDIANHVLSLCKTDEELQRAGQELIMSQDRNMFDLLIYLKYLVDTMRKHNVVWGVGRGSSVASFVLFLIGIHRINSLFYEIPIEEFLK